MVSTPSPPDPYQTAMSQAAFNTNAAATQQAFNNVNQVTPDGSLKYSVTGNYGGYPLWTATTKLSPENQRVYEQTQGTKLNLATTGNEQSAKLRAILNTPFNLDVSKGKYLDDMVRTRLDPQWAQNEQSFEQSMVDRGIHPGSQAYTQARAGFDQAKNDAYTQMYLQGQGQANQAAFAERNQPLNEIAALESGSQVSQPNFINTPQTQVASTNFSGLAQQDYQQKLNQSNAMMGGLFGMAGTGTQLAMGFMPGMSGPKIGPGTSGLY